MVANADYTQKVRELLIREGPKTPKEIMESCGHLTHAAYPSCLLRYTEDINYLGSKKLGVYYIGDREQAEKMLEKLRSESMQRHSRELPLNPDIEMAIDVFTGFDLELSATDVWKRRGGKFMHIYRTLREYEKSGVLLARREGGEKLYRLNPKGLYVVADGFYKRAEEQLLHATKEHAKEFVS